jgi:hypothetical protein
MKSRGVGTYHHPARHTESETSMTTANGLAVRRALEAAGVELD